MADEVEWPDDDIPDTGRNQAPILVPPPVPPSPVAARPVLPPPRLAPAPVGVPPPLTPQAAPPKRSNGLAVAAIGIVAAAAIGLVAVAVVLSGRDEPAALASSPTAAAASLPAPKPAVTGPVTDLRLTDDGDTALVEWVYPRGASGPVIVSAALAGQPMRAMQSLPEGTQSYTLPGLDPKRDYCIAVTIAYSTERMVMSEPVCTKRSG